MARPKIPEELKKAHWRLYMSKYRQQKKREQFDNHLCKPISAPPPFRAGQAASNYDEGEKRI